MMSITRRHFNTVRNLTLGLVLAGAMSAATEVHFGPTALAATETARLAAYCDGSVVPGPCDITFEFLAADGSVLLERTMLLQPGTGGFLDLPASRAGIGRGRGLIDPCRDIERGAAFASLEIFDTGNLRTHLLINWGDRSVPRSGDIEFGLAGITRSDTARLGAFCPGEAARAEPACQVHFEFHDINGRLLKQSDVTLQPGAAGFLDLSSTETVSGAGRVMIQPCLKVDGGAAVATLAVIDNGLGQAGVQAYPAVLAMGAQ
jgi:hypothetical protein